MSYDQLPVLGDNPQGSFSNVKDRLVDADNKVITEIDMWQTTASTGYITGNNYITANWSRSINTNLPGAVHKGIGLSESNGVFSFPSTGIYEIHSRIYLPNNVSNAYVYTRMETTVDNFTSYWVRDINITSVPGQVVSDTVTISANCLAITDIANQKFKFLTVSAAGTDYTINGSIDHFYTGFICKKIGEI